MQVGQVQLKVELVAEQVLTEGAPEHRLDGVLGHSMYPQPVDIRIAVLAVGALVHLGAKESRCSQGSKGGQVQFGVPHQPIVTPGQLFSGHTLSHALHAGAGLPRDPKADHSWFSARAR